MGLLHTESISDRTVNSRTKRTRSRGESNAIGLCVPRAIHGVCLIHGRLLVLSKNIRELIYASCLAIWFRSKSSELNKIYPE